MSISLTRTQTDLMRIIQELSDAGCAVTLKMLAREMDIGRSGVHRILACLKERGWIDWPPRRKPMRITLLKRVNMPAELRVAPVIEFPAWLLDTQAAPQTGEAA